jgi:hypothetical protein
MKHHDIVQLTPSLHHNISARVSFPDWSTDSWPLRSTNERLKKKRTLVETLPMSWFKTLYSKLHISSSASIKSSFQVICGIVGVMFLKLLHYGRMGRGGHGLPKVSLGLAMPYSSTSCGLATPKTALRCDPIAGRSTCSRLLHLWPHHAVRLWCFNGTPFNWDLIIKWLKLSVKFFVASRFLIVWIS